MRLKPGVRVRGASSEIVLALHVADGLYRNQGLSVTVTSLTDGQHMIGSLHHCGQAVDIRKPPADHEPMRQALQAALGDDFDVIDEASHFHIEHDPK